MNKDIQLTEDEFRANLERNPDGTGVMFHTDGKVIVRKELGDTEEQVKLFKKYRKSAAKGGLKEVFIHSRYATKGKVTAENLHPFQILDGKDGAPELWAMHNGTIKDAVITDEGYSDTYNFFKYYLAPLVEGRPELLENIFFQEMIQKYMGHTGTGNKLVFLDSTGRTTYINRDKGTEYKGCWISNTYSNINSPSKKPAGYSRPANTYNNGYSTTGWKQGMIWNKATETWEWPNSTGRAGYWAGGKWVSTTDKKSTWPKNSKEEEQKIQDDADAKELAAIEEANKASAGGIGAMDQQGNSITIDSMFQNKEEAQVLTDKVAAASAKKEADAAGTNVTRMLDFSKKKEDSAATKEATPAEPEEADQEAASFELKAVETGLQVVISSLTFMSEKDVYNFVLQQPILAAEAIQELLLDKELIIAA